MATAGRSEDNPLISCNSCRSQVSDNLLPCFHKLCNQCVANATITDQRAVLCSVCGLTCRLDEIRKYIYSHLAMKTRCKGGDCPDQGIAVYQCVQCNEALCDGCTDAHRRVTATKNHQLTPTPVSRHESCPAHPSYPTRLRCRCNAAICDQCTHDRHVGPDHAYMEERLMAIKYREDCKQIVEKAAHQRTRTEAGIQMVTQRMVELDEAAQITRRLIGESIVQMTGEIVKRGHEMCANVDAMAKARKNGYEHIRRKLQQTIGKYERVTELALELSKQSTHPKAVIETRTGLIDFYNQCDISDECQHLQHSPRLQYTANAKRLLDAIANFGEIQFAPVSANTIHYRQQQQQPTAVVMNQSNGAQLRCFVPTNQQQQQQRLPYPHQQPRVPSNAAATPPPYMQQQQQPRLLPASLPPNRTISQQQQSSGAYLLNHPSSPINHAYRPISAHTLLQQSFGYSCAQQQRASLPTTLSAPTGTLLPRSALSYPNSILRQQSPPQPSVIGSTTIIPSATGATPLPSSNPVTQLIQFATTSTPPISSDSGVTSSDTSRLLSSSTIAVDAIVRNGSTIRSSGGARINEIVQQLAVRQTTNVTEVVTTSSSSSPTSSNTVVMDQKEVTEVKSPGQKVDNTPTNDNQAIKNNDDENICKATTTTIADEASSPISSSSSSGDNTNVAENSTNARTTPDAQLVTTTTAANDAEKSTSRTNKDDSYWEDYCFVCQQGCDERSGNLGCCAVCPHVYHNICHVPAIATQMEDLPDEWTCSLCCTAFDPLTTKRTGGDKTPMTENERLLCSKVLLCLYADHNGVAPFATPVDASFVEYHAVIKHPSDFSTIAKRLVVHSSSPHQPFAFVEDFIDAMNRVFKNCSTFNPMESQIAESGRILYREYRRAVETFMPAMTDHIWKYATLCKKRAMPPPLKVPQSDDHNGAGASSTDAGGRRSKRSRSDYS